MRFQFIFSNLACGSLMENIGDMEKVFSQGITHVINLQIGCETQLWYFSEMRQKYPDVEFLHLYFTDDKQDKPFWIWNTILEYTKSVLTASQDHKLYVHCALGESRSPAVIYLLLRVMWQYSQQKAKEVLHKNYFKKIRGIEKKYKEYIPGIDHYIEIMEIGGEK